MKKLMAICAVVTMISVLSIAAQAVTMVPLGSAGGGIMINYNNIDISGESGTPDGVVSGYDEKENNQAYIRAQFGYDNTNGAGFQFDNTDYGSGWEQSVRL
jgi:opacity protein-like surface antigen